MERSEPSLVPEWLRSNGGGGSIHRFASSQADSAFPGRSRSSKSINNTNFLRSPLLDRSSSSNYRRSSNINGSSKQDRGSHALSYSSFSKNRRDRDREQSKNADIWDSEYSDLLRRSKSLISRRQGDAPLRRNSVDVRNGGDMNHHTGNSINAVGGDSVGIQKVSFERDFPVLGSEERPKTPDIIRVASPGLSRGIQSLCVGNSTLVGSEAWTTSALVERTSVLGSNSCTGTLPATTACSSSSVLVSASTTSGHNMAATLVHAPAHAHNNPQKDEMAVAHSKKLIPLTPLVPKTTVLNQSDKLKPKTAGRSNDVVTGSKNGLHPMTDSPKSSGMSLLKPSWEKGVSPSLKDIPSAAPNGSSTGVPSLISAPFSNPTNKKRPVSDHRKTSYSLSTVPMMDKRLSLAQLRSRNDFLNLIRKKSSVSSSAVVNSGTVVPPSMSISDESKETVVCGLVTSTENGEGKCDSGQKESHNEVIHTAEELEFLHALGWKEDEGDDDEGLTEEEIDSFVRKYITSKSAAKLLRGLQLKMIPEAETQGLCTNGGASERSTSAAQM